jgi:TolB-like protein/Flp pilus assembly protein TadD
MEREGVGVPAELQRIVTRALRKDREERYQTARELLLDLKAFKKQAEFEVQLGEQGYRGRIPAPSESNAALGAASVASLGRTFCSNAWNSQSAATPAETQVAVSPPKRFGHLLWSGIAGLVVLAALASVYFTGIGRARTLDSIAVLPFENASADAGQDYLSEGLTENLINGLSRLEPLKVLASGSVIRFRGKVVEPRKAGQELKVEAVVTGRVSRQQGDLTVSIALVDSAKGFQIWGETYRRQASEMPGLEEEIERNIVAKLQVKATPEQIQKLKPATRRADAYELYLKGRHAMEKFSLEGRKEAIDDFTQALARDPQYALAYAGLSSANGVLAFSESPGVWMPKARTAAQRALELDPTLAEAHVSLGWVFERYDWNWTGAETEFKRAIELNPRAGDGFDRLALFYMRTKRWDEAVATEQKGIDITPLSGSYIVNLGWMYYHQRDYDRAIEDYRKALAIDPDMAWAHTQLGGAYRQKSLFPEAIEEGRKAVVLSQDYTHLVALARTLAAAGQRQEAEAILGQLLAKSKQGYASPYFIAWIYAALGQREPTFEWLQKALVERNVNLPYVRIEPEFDKFHQDPRYAALLRGMNLSP